MTKKKKNEVSEFIEKFYKTSQDMEVMVGELKKTADNLLILGEGGLLAELPTELNCFTDVLCIQY
ncbi:MAG: hypothetical protein ACE5IH_07985 [Thermodesulfobacteriota bacterium]